MICGDDHARITAGRKEILSLPDSSACDILCERETIEPGGYPPFPEGLTLQTKERRALPMYVTYSDLIQVGIFICALVGLCYTIFRGKK